MLRISVYKHSTELFVFPSAGGWFYLKIIHQTLANFEHLPEIPPDDLQAPTIRKSQRPSLYLSLYQFSPYSSLPFFHILILV